MPWASAIFGEAQYQLCLAVLWENACEPGSFGPLSPMWHPIGTPLPPQPPQPDVLGVDHSVAPTWEVDAHIGDLSFVMEKVATPASTPGTGPKLCKVSRMPLAHLLACPPSGFLLGSGCAWALAQQSL